MRESRRKIDGDDIAAGTAGVLDCGGDRRAVEDLDVIGAADRDQHRARRRSGNQAVLAADDHARRAGSVAWIGRSGGERIGRIVVAVEDVPGTRQIERGGIHFGVLADTGVGLSDKDALAAGGKARPCPQHAHLRQRPALVGGRIVVDPAQSLECIDGFRRHFCAGLKRVGIDLRAKIGFRGEQAACVRKLVGDREQHLARQRAPMPGKRRTRMRRTFRICFLEQRLQRESPVANNAERLPFGGDVRRLRIFQRKPQPVRRKAQLRVRVGVPPASPVATQQLEPRHISRPLKLSN